MSEENSSLTGVPDVPSHPLNAQVMGGDQTGAYLYVASGNQVVLLCEHGEAPRWRNSIGLEPEQARKLGTALISMAWQAEHPGDDDDG